MTKNDINFYYCKSRFSCVWSIRINKRVITVRLDKTARFWRPSFVTYRLEYLDLTALYYEGGLLKYERNEN